MLVGKNKKAQVGETLTWIVATLVIIGTLLIFVYGSILLAKSKSIGSGDIDNKIKSKVVNLDVDWMDNKNEIAFSLNQDNKDKIEGWLNETRENP